MEGRIRGKRSDRLNHIATAIIAIAQGATTWREIAEDLGITMRATFNLLKDLEREKRILVERPVGIQNHNTKKVKYSLLDDLGSFSYYLMLLHGFPNDYIKKFMLTDYYNAAISKTCKIITDYKEGIKVSGYYLFKQPIGKKEVSLEDAKKAYGAFIHSFFDEILRSQGVKINHDEWKAQEKKGWTWLPDPLNVAIKLKFDFESAKKLLYEDHGEPPADVLKQLVPPNSEEDPLNRKALYNTKVRLLGTEKAKLFDKIQRDVAITNAAINDDIFYDVLYRVITTFPDSAVAVGKEISWMISRIMPAGYDEKNVGSLFRLNNYFIGDKWAHSGLLLFPLGSNLFYGIFGGASEGLLVSAMFSISNDNAIIPDQFLEKYVLGSINEKKEQ